MRDTFQVATLNEFIEFDYEGKALGKQAAYVLAEYMCRTTKDTSFLYKNSNIGLGAFQWDEMTGKTFFQSLVEESTIVYIKDFFDDCYTATIRGYIDVKEYVNLHDCCSWDKEALSKHIPRIKISKENNSNLNNFINYLKKAGCEVKMQDEKKGDSVRENNI